MSVVFSWDDSLGEGRAPLARASGAGVGGNDRAPPERRTSRLPQRYVGLIWLMSCCEPALAAEVSHKAHGPVITAMLACVCGITLVLAVYCIRHYVFTLNRLFAAQRHPYIDVDTADWPTLTVFIAAHNEEAVIKDALTALLNADYPRSKLQITPVNDRSTDNTEVIVDQFVARYPLRLLPFHRRSGKPGKAAALKDAMAYVHSEVIIVFDADYVPSRGLLKQLVAPLFDPEVGAVMGRVVPCNADTNLLTRLLDLERSGGYQVDQQARMNLGLVPQYGGTVGSVRVSALQCVGGWHDDVLAEDTDLTYRLLLAGWKIAYQNRSECYEEVPEAWAVRVKQIMRWTKGHNQVLVRHGRKIISNPFLTPMEKADAILLLGVYAVAPLVIIGWVLSIGLYFFDALPFGSGILVAFAFFAYSTVGNFAAFFEIAAAVRMDRNRGRIRLLPLNFLGFLTSVVSISRATLNQLFWDRWSKGGLQWDKTVRYRKAT
ncbi:MAG: glycosyltransferase family 2 protein [Burkholderiaceae bacterium]